jgi:hypothetical protein
MQRKFIFGAAPVYLLKWSAQLPGIAECGWCGFEMTTLSIND